jgi:hypothetical protein
MATVLTSLLAHERETSVFVKAETTFGVGVKPGASDQVLAIAEIDPAQNLPRIADAQRRNTYSMLSDFPGRFEPGELTLPIYMKPSGSAGTAPEGDILYEALFGRKVVTGGVSVEYKPLLVGGTRKSVTIWVKKGHFVYMCWGTLLQRGRFPLRAGNGDDALSQVEFSAQFAELRWTGTDELGVAIAGPGPTTTFTAKDAKKFTVGSYIKIGNDDNGGAGFEVTAVNYGTNVVTINPGVSGAVAVDTLIAPWLPAGTEAGEPVHGRLGIATRGGVNLPLLSGEIIYSFPAKLMNEEKNNKDFADRFINGQREVSVSAEIYFDANAARFFYDYRNNVKANMAFPWGTTAGKTITLTALNVPLDAPRISGGEEKVQRLEGKAFASAALDDELVLKFS